MYKAVIAFVILHYIATDLTIKCVKSLESLDGLDDTFSIHIVVVDNGSPNNSGEFLTSMYCEDEKVDVIINKDNLGFSKANNIGFRYACKAYNPDFIGVLNNDITIDQKDFLSKLIAVFEKQSDCYILGPDIYVKRKALHQSPMSGTLPNKYSVVSQLQAILHPSIKVWIKKKLLINKFLRNQIEARDIRKMRKSIKWNIRQINVVLHGACIFYTRNFIDTGEDPFSPETFMYCEEDILAIRCHRNGWKSVYDPLVQVIHYDDGSTDISNAKYLQKQAFIDNNRVESLNIILNMLYGDSDAE